MSSDNILRALVLKYNSGMGNQIGPRGGVEGGILGLGLGGYFGWPPKPDLTEKVVRLRPK